MTGASVSFADQLVAAHGRPMERALIRVRQRYAAAKPARGRLIKIHREYGRRRR